ncbi:selenide, water dikinase SelD [Aliarcobacter trophiarum LMG 25534]|uniref:Selenide, water dikinase n=1 Tax=Aliarcobacter trophiarum LMG 25534 TaxID=1032241 RepID=A0AAD0QJ46_9BACT|nr:selenide, water dikinase SelD [Aliarcobacter trophiarum]AXK48984.1 selenophosphate synthetase [Aliarcobacter trophiarum LMG 25534]RXI24837.1 selenide, water dikinase SelD [Aliarcobacter trophiarum]RXJ92714.1 selenide, water dikinase SelD [Aliarcobacter trophiarum LMG 25534]
MNNEYKLTKFVQAAGCAAKMGPGDLKQALCNLKAENEHILVGFDTSDDAGIYQINDDLALVQTVDFITPVVDDPYIYGQIAAANSLSDIFAMGADVKTALNVVGFDATNISKEALGEILRGGNDKIKECGGSLLGGHTIQTPEMYYGLSVTGIIHPNNIIRNNSAKVGDLLVLTKPLGMGVLTTAIKRDLIPLNLIKHCADIMSSLNYIPSKIMKKYRVSSCTDITGFGLLGHAFECINQNISFSISTNEVPFVKEAFSFCKDGVLPGGSKRNMKFIEDKIIFKTEIDPILQAILCDAQTSGGLLIAINKEDAKEFINEIEDYSFGYAKIIGEVVKRGEKPIILG